MKKIIGIVIASLMFCNIGYARDIREIDDPYSAQLTKYIQTVCVDGYKFVVWEGEVSSMVQFLKELVEYRFQRSVKNRKEGTWINILNLF